MGKIDRREFLEEVIATQSRQPANAGVDKVYEQYANKTLPTGLSKTTASLAPYTGPWTQAEVVHLLRRTTFGVKYADVQSFLRMSAGNAVDALLNVPAAAPAPPVNNYQATYADPTGVALGQTWVTAAYGDGTVNGQRNNSFTAWWTGLMLNQAPNILEKMVLFWHNHFATEISAIGDARLSYNHNAMLRANALGNFKTLVKNVTIDAAMLRYLNGYLNSKTSPDENYGRELQELFTIGKGFTPIYIEDDVKAAAQVLTGWRVNTTTMAGYFDSTKHVTTNKLFSSFYNNTTITGKTGANGALETDELINMLFAKQETALHICRKLYRYFVYYVIDSSTEANIIVPMAQALVTNGFNIKPVLQTLLKSQHFFDVNSQGCYIRTPMDFLIGVFRTFSVTIPAMTVDKTYAIWNYIRTYGKTLAMELGEPPNVAGWPSYYQEPDYYELWINSNTLPKRMAFTDMMLGSGFSAGTGTAIKIDVLAFSKLCPDVSDPTKFVDFCVAMLLGLDLSVATKTTMKVDTLLSKQTSDYYWTQAWADYITTPNTTNTNIVKTRLTSLLTTLTRLAEHHLC